MIYTSSIDDVSREYRSAIESVEEWCNNLYEERFEHHFSGFRDVFRKLRNSGSKITDAELEDLLITLPITLFDASESLSVLRIATETVKIGTKRKSDNAANLGRKAGLSSTAAKEFAASEVLDDKLLITAYESVISRVESEISFCREMIMSAKKIWDARRKTDIANPVTEVSELPEFVPDQKKTYVKGV